jgi:hypothetical protein
MFKTKSTFRFRMTTWQRGSYYCTCWSCNYTMVSFSTRASHDNRARAPGTATPDERKEEEKLRKTAYNTMIRVSKDHAMETRERRYLRRRQRATKFDEMDEHLYNSRWSPYEKEQQRFRVKYTELYKEMVCRDSYNRKKQLC